VGRLDSALFAGVRIDIALGRPVVALGGVGVCLVVCLYVRSVSASVSADGMLAAAQAKASDAT
jgi:hypothetical protein